MPDTYFEPIIPKGPIVRVNAAVVVREMQRFSYDALRRAATYPPQQSYSSRRTGHLGRGWSAVGFIGAIIDAGDLVGGIGNNVVYSKRVMGFRKQAPYQDDLFASYGWESVEIIGEEEWRKHSPRIEAALQGR